jgi:hypothetical protein
MQSAGERTLPAAWGQSRVSYGKIALECWPLESYATPRASYDLLIPTMNGTPKLICLILSFLIIASLPGLGRSATSQ